MAAALAAQANGQVVRMPSPAEREEMERINRMNVRTNAANFACNAASTGDWPVGDIIDLAGRLEAFIWGGTP